MEIRLRLILTVLAVLIAVFPNVGSGQVELDLAGLSLEELMDVRVSLVSRKAEPLREAPAAVAVITGEELQRSGATSLAEALRLVPGMQVARIDANKWAIGARGFNSRFANKLLVQIDGRSVYAPMFSGVFWEEQDLVVEDIERIEVIRGPGAALWGANAVDGVINIVSRSAEETQGTLLRLGGGVEERGFGTVRHGGRIGEGLHYRLYAKLFDRDAFRGVDGRSAHDGWHQGRGGFRADWIPGGRDQLMLQGALYGGKMDQQAQFIVMEPPYADAFLREIEVAGAHLLGRWTRTKSDDSELALQVYFDWTRRKESLDERRRTFDVDFQHRLQLGARQELIWGGGFRTSYDEIEGNSFSVNIEPPQRRIDLFSAFVQDELQLVEEQLVLTAGTKFEHNDFTGVEIQPSARLRWMPLANQTFWVAASQAVRTPSRVDDDMRFAVGVLAPGASFLGLPALPEGSPPVFLVLTGNRDFDSETVRALEAGYRWGIGERWLVDIALFRNRYDKLSDAALGSTTFFEEPWPHSIMTLDTINGIEGRTGGVEVAVEGRLLPWWRLRAGYTRLQLELVSQGAFIDQLQVDATTPKHQGTLCSNMDWNGWALDGLLRYVDALPRLGVDEYFDLDLRLARSLGEGIEIALVGKSLLDSGHLEFVPRFISGPPVEVERRLFGTFTCRF